MIDSASLVSAGQDGYRPIAECLRARNCGLSFTCIEMSDTDNPEYRQSSPEGQLFDQEPCTLNGLLCLI